MKKVDADGRITLADGRILAKNYRQFVRGFAITSYASQGKTVDHVLFSDSAVKAATNQQQWYVTISRGRKGITIFTSDKAQLRENILRSGDRPWHWIWRSSAIFNVSAFLAGYGRCACAFRRMPKGFGSAGSIASPSYEHGQSNKHRE